MLASYRPSAPQYTEPPLPAAAGPATAAEMPAAARTAAADAAEAAACACPALRPVSRRKARRPAAGGCSCCCDEAQGPEHDHDGEDGHEHVYGGRPREIGGATILLLLGLLLARAYPLPGMALLIAAYLLSGWRVLLAAGRV